MKWTSVKVVPGRIGGDGPSSPSVGSGRKLKPAVYDPTSVDIDNDGKHQEGTTAEWYGIGRNNIAFSQILNSFNDRGAGVELNDTVRKQFIELEVRRNAPPAMQSDQNTDISFIGGVITSSSDWKEGQDLSSAQLMMANRFLKFREEQRSSLRSDPAVDAGEEELEIDDDGSVKTAIKKLVAARKKRRQERESRFQDEVNRMIDDDTRQMAADYKDRFISQDIKEGYDDIYRRVQSDYAKTTPRPLSTDWESSPEIAEWDRTHPIPRARDMEEGEDFREALSEWDDERFTKLWDLSKPEREAWTAEVERLAAEEFEKVNGRPPGEGTEDLAGKMDVLTSLFSFTAVGKDGEKYDFQVENVIDTWGSLMIQGGVYVSGYGIHVGTFERSFNDETGDVHHDHLIFSSEARSLGLASIFNARNEEIYRLMGFESISTAGLSNTEEYIGATHWPKNGFDWTDEWERDKFLDRINTFIQYWEAKKKADPSKDVTIPTKKQVLNASSGSWEDVQMDVPLFASQEELELIRKMVTMAKSQNFNDPSRMVADDLLQFSGAEEAFKHWKSTINYIRYI